MPVPFICPICESSTYTPFLVCKDHVVSNEFFNLVECSSCHFLITYPQPKAEELGRYYQSEEYISHSGTRKGLINQLYHLIRRYTIRSKGKLIYSQAGHAGHILDIGCGTGAFLYHVKKQGWKVKGIEPDHKARAIASKLLEQEIGNTSDLTAYKAGQFDMVTLWHVLEHIPDLSQMLKQIHFVLQEKGLVLIAVPNSLSYDAQHYKEYWAAYDVPRHLWHFTPDTMQALMTKESFDLVKILPMWFDSFYVSMLSEKFQHRSNGIVGGILNGFISNAKALFSNENKYSSQIYMFRKR